LPPSQTVQARFRAYSFPKEALHSIGNMRRTYAFRGLLTLAVQECHPLPPFALRPDLPISLVERYFHDVR